MESMMSQKVTAIQSVSDLETFGTFIPRTASIINFYKQIYSANSRKKQQWKQQNLKGWGRTWKEIKQGPAKPNSITNWYILNEQQENRSHTDQSLPPPLCGGWHLRWEHTTTSNPTPAKGINFKKNTDQSIPYQNKLPTAPSSCCGQAGEAKMLHGL